MSHGGDSGEGGSGTFLPEPLTPPGPRWPSITASTPRLSPRSQVRLRPPYAGRMPVAAASAAGRWVSGRPWGRPCIRCCTGPPHGSDPGRAWGWMRGRVGVWRSWLVRASRWGRRGNQPSAGPWATEVAFLLLPRCLDFSTPL